VSVLASVNELKAQGWTRANGITNHDTWPSSGAVIMTKNGYYLEHAYAIREDDSDWLGDDGLVRWWPCSVYEEVRRYTKRLPDETVVPFDERLAAEARKDQRVAEARAKAQQDEARERAEYERLAKKFGGSP
jgi:hypothetical protein